MDESEVSEGGCACGAVRFVVVGKALRSGLCHCLTCQRAHGGPFFPFVVFCRDQVRLTGPLRTWHSTAAYSRCFCTACGSRVASLTNDAVELCSTQFDRAGMFPPQYESWTIRRQPWLKPLAVVQYARDREDGEVCAGGDAFGGDGRA
ncbi:hypothetical protein ASE00_14525 [Sphingomonas sp. Root710]|uniref:GFA family protein n=1 Tax=Sphingomonas sp. Root710 TaxID=1736594 RepID=UPI0006F4AF18|nr:GFA family protein [Sphingomonas sp. Root710]KRB81215.1 hypothetical protein ASE00_14525 [Sphingomonas sp. Root710]